MSPYGGKNVFEILRHMISRDRGYEAYCSRGAILGIGAGVVLVIRRRMNVQ